MNELNPQVRVLLDQIQAEAARQPVPASSLSAREEILAIRQKMSGIAVLGIAPEAVAQVQNLEIPSPGGLIPIRLYVPYTEEPVRDVLPAFVFYHGGGFIAGTLDDYDGLLRALANRAQCLIVSVAYRLAPENPYPAGNLDAWAALAWVADHALEIGADPQRVAVGGDSAGGLMAAWVAQKAAKKDLKLRLQILLHPCLDATTSSQSWKELATGYGITHEQMKKWYDLYLPKGIDRRDAKVSPLFATDLSGVAPALMITADHDPLHDEGDEYAAKLKAANVPVDHTCLPGMIHGLASIAGVVDEGKVLIDQLGVKLRRALK